MFVYSSRYYDTINCNLAYFSLLFLIFVFRDFETAHCEMPGWREYNKNMRTWRPTTKRRDKQSF